MVSSTDPVDNYVHEIVSARVLERACDQLRELAGEDCRLGDLRGSVSAERMERTDIIKITSVGSTPQGATNMAHFVAMAFIVCHDDAISENAANVYDALAKDRDATIARLTEQQAQLREQLGSKAVADTGDEEIRLLSIELVQTKIRLETLREAGFYTDEYPEILACENKIVAIERHIEDIAARNEQSITTRREYEHAVGLADRMDEFFMKRLEEARIAKTKKSERIDIIEPPTPPVMVTKAPAHLLALGFLLGAMLGIVMAFVAENLDTSIRTLVEIEETFRLPILGVIPNFSRASANIPLRPETLWDRIRYSETLSSVRVVGQSFKSVFSRKSRQGRSPTSGRDSLIVPFAPRSPATEGYRAIRTNLQFAAGESNIGPFLITSPGPGEGKSTTIANLALAFAQTGKRVLLVGANMRRPSMYRIFGLERERGLAEILVGELPWRDVLRDHRDIALGERSEDSLATATGMENLFIITCGGRTIQPAEWLAQPIFESLVKEWHAEYDVVLIDGTPVLPVPDSVIMAGAVKHVVLVYQGGVTQRDSMRLTISTLQKTGADITGMVLNDLHASWSASPDYFHYRGYYGRPEKSR